MTSRNQTKETKPPAIPTSLSRQIRQYYALSRSEQSRLFSKNDRRKVGDPEELPYNSPMQHFVKQCLIERQRIRKLKGEEYGFTKALESLQSFEYDNLESLRRSIYWDDVVLGKRDRKEVSKTPVREWIEGLGKERDGIRVLEGLDGRAGREALRAYWERYKIDRRWLDLWVSWGVFEG